jgi:hypothetical protein
MIYTSEDFKQTLKEMLHGNEEVTVKFTKKDGSDRTMLCTLNEQKIPFDKLPKLKETSEETPAVASIVDAVRVFDVEKQEWRSFRFDSIKSVKVGV